MTNAINIFETRSLALTSEILHQILKKYKVELLNIEIPGDSSVITYLFGEYSEIKISGEKAYEISKSFVSYFSQQIITKPDEKLFDLLRLTKKSDSKIEISQHKEIQKRERKILRKQPEPKNIEKYFVEPKNGVSQEEIPVSENIIAEESAPRDKSSVVKNKKEKSSEIKSSPVKNVIQNPTIARLKKEALGKKTDEAKNISDQQSDKLNAATFEELSTYNVHKLRRYARNFSNFPIKGREISRANRMELLNYFKDLI